MTEAIQSGISADVLAMSLALGTVAGIFPILGLTTVVAIAFFGLYGRQSNWAIVTVRTALSAACTVVERGVDPPPPLPGMSADVFLCAQVVNLLLAPVDVMLMPVFMKLGLLLLGGGESFSFEGVMQV